MLAGPVGTTVNNNVRAAAAAAVSNNNNNGTRPDHLVCFDGDARYDIQAKGYQDGVNDFNHVKHYPVVPFSMLNATEISLYRQGYHDGWMDAKVNGTAMDKSCYEDNIS